MEEHSTKPPAGIVITRMRADHLDDLAALERAAFSRPWSYDALAEELQNPLAVFFVAEDTQTHHAAGYIGMYHIIDEGDIANLAVYPGCRRRGIASALLKAAAEYAESHKVVRLTLEVRVSNAPAIGLYERFGFTRDGIRPGFYDSPKEDAAIYSLYF